MEIGKNEVFAAAGSMVSYIIFSLLVFVSGVSSGSLVNLQNSLLESMVLGTHGMTTTSALAAVVSPFVPLAISVAFLSLSFAFLSSYGYHKPDRRIGIVAGAANAVITIAFFPTLTGMFVAIAVLISAIYIIDLSNAYGNELKKWVRFRVGSNSVGKALMIFNIFLAVGLFLSVLGSLQFYESSFKGSLYDSMKEIALASIPSGINAPGVREEVEERITASLSESPLINAYVRWLPVLSALSVWVIMEFLRNMVFSNIGGMLGFLLSRFYNERE